MRVGHIAWLAFKAARMDIVAPSVHYLSICTKRFSNYVIFLRPELQISGYFKQRVQLTVTWTTFNDFEYGMGISPGTNAQASLRCEWATVGSWIVLVAADGRAGVEKWLRRMNVMVAPLVSLRSEELLLLEMYKKTAWRWSCKQCTSSTLILSKASPPTFLCSPAAMDALQRQMVQ